MRVWVLSGLMLAGCSESVSEVIASRRAAVEKTFASLHALKVPETAPEKVTVDGIHLEGGDVTNAAFIYADDLAKPGDVAPVPLRSLDSLPLLQCGRLLKDGMLVDSPFAPKPSIARQYLEACARVRYAFVIQTIEYIAPRPPPAESLKFIPGSYRARVTVMDMSTNSALGSYEFAVGSDNDIRVPEGTPTVEQLVTNLEGNAYRGLRASTNRSVPGALKVK
ncbi:MAG: hypothetical protein ACO1OB_18080 [Archangium sp.]